MASGQRLHGRVFPRDPAGLGPEKGIDVDEKTASGPSRVVTVGTDGGVPVRTILTTIGLVAAAAVAVLFVMRVERVLIWMLVALFFAVALYPLVDWVQRRVLRRRSLATLLVFLVVLIAIGAPAERLRGATGPGGHPTRRAATSPDQRRAGRARPGRQAAGAHQRRGIRAEQRGTHPRVRDRSRHARAQRAARREHRARRDRDDLRPGLPDRARRTEGRHGHTRSSPSAARRAHSEGHPRLRQDRHRLYLRQPAHQRDLRHAHLRRAQDLRRAVRRPDRAVRRDRRPHPARRRHPRRGRRGHCRVHTLRARRYRRRSSSSSSTSNWRTTCCSR